MPKKKHMQRKIYQQRNTKQNLRLSWTFLLPNLRSKNMALNLFHFTLTFHLNTGKNQRLYCLAFLASSRLCLSRTTMKHTHNGHGDLCMKDYYGISQKFLVWRMAGGKFQENNKSLESCSNFQNWRTPKFGKWAVSPRWKLCFGRRIISKLYRLAHLFLNG